MFIEIMVLFMTLIMLYTILEIRDLRNKNDILMDNQEILQTRIDELDEDLTTLENSELYEINLEEK